MESNPHLQSAILQVINNQIRANDPPETKQTYERLLKEGFDKEETRRLIGQAVAVEIFHVLKSGKPYNRDRYVKALSRLPELPED